MFQKLKNAFEKFVFIKNKKTISFILLLSITVGIILPQIANAGWLGCGVGAATGAGAGVAIGTVFPVVGNVVGGAVGGAIGCITGWIWGESITKEVGGWILYGAVELMLIISKFALEVSSGIFVGMTNSAILNQPMTRGSGMAATTVLHGWAIVRDFTNMFIVLGFVVIGIATILRIREYEAQKKLVPLIIVALLINFSLLICGIVIDATNITINYFTQVSGPTQVVRPITDTVMSPEIMDLLEKLANNEEWKAFASAGFGVVAYSLLSAMIFFIYGILLLFRYVALMLLVILSPLAFVCSVFPATQNIYQKWKSQFIQWAIIGIPTAFFVYLAGWMIATPKETAMLSFWIPAAFLLFAYSLIFQTSAIGASAAIGLATGAMGYAVGASKWAGGKALRGAANLTGATRLGSAAKDTVTSIGERLKLVGAGTTAANQRARLSEKGRDARINAMSAEEKVQELQRVRWGREGRLDRAKIVESLAKENKLDMIPAGQRQALIANAMAHGVRAKDLVGGMQSADLATIINTNQYDTETRAEAFKALSKRKDLDLIQHPTNPALTPALRQTTFNEAIQHGVRPEEIEKADYHYARYNAARLDRIRIANPTFTQAQIENAAIEQTLDENITSMDHDQLRNIDATHLTHQRVDRLTPDKIAAFQLAPRTSRLAIRQHFRAGGQLRQDMLDAWNEYQTALTGGDQAAANNRFAEYRRLLSLHRSSGRLPTT